MGTLKDMVENITPTEFSKINGSRQETSTRDKQRFFLKISDVETFFEKIEKEIILKK